MNYIKNSKTLKSFYGLSFIGIVESLDKSVVGQLGKLSTLTDERGGDGGVDFQNI